MKKTQITGLNKGTIINKEPTNPNQKVGQIRGRIIDYYIQIELLINAFLTNYFVLENKHSDFLTKFLYDDFCSTGLKIRVLEKLLPENKIVRGFYVELRRLTNIRNIAAHSYPMSLNGPIVLETRKLESKDLRVLEEEFFKIYKKVFPLLIDAVNKLIEDKVKMS
ncbi:hypothetical protein HYX07_04575 [Candidatus Woesearchaeota archaeon]|nr:hypothetical protein [Candidatus Woesearchaeota archaeon]